MATQTEIPGTERKRYESIENAADEYQAVRDKRMKLTPQEVDAKARLLKAMRRQKLEQYRCDDGRLVEIEEGEATVKVRGPKKEANGADE
jgi:hypothetical protein